ncbi:unnamed protein product [Pedinophyceae sp. YPF-701]|nr:unnamed protein product [Pedinophyceae sp. YPF-701]
MRLAGAATAALIVLVLSTVVGAWRIPGLGAREAKQKEPSHPAIQAEGALATLDININAGKDLIETYRDIGSPCWREAVSNIEGSCKALSEDEQARLAIALLSCHLVSSGRRGAACPRASSVAQCTSGRSFDFNLFTQFKLKIVDMCAYVQSLSWRQDTAHVLEAMGDASLAAARSLTAVRGSLDSVAEAHAGLKETIVTHADSLRAMVSGMEASMRAAREESTEHAATASKLLTDLSAAAEHMRDKQRHLTQAVDVLSAYIDRTSALLTAVLGKQHSWQDALAYTAALLAAWAAGALPCFAGLRFPLMAVVAATLLAERHLAHSLHFMLVADPGGSLWLPLPSAVAGAMPRAAVTAGVWSPLGLSFRWAVRFAGIAIGACAAAWSLWRALKRGGESGEYSSVDERVAAMEQRLSRLPEDVRAVVREEVRSLVHQVAWGGVGSPQGRSMLPGVEWAAPGRGEATVPTSPRTPASPLRGAGAAEGSPLSERMTVKELKKMARELNIELEGNERKQELLDILGEALGS